MLSRRKLLTFSLRSMIAMVTMSGTVCWFIRRRLARSQRQAQVVDEIQRLGGVVGYAHEWDNISDRATGLPIPGPPLLRKILGDHYFLTPTLILFDESSISTAELPTMNELSCVTNLAFANCPHIDDGIAELIVQLPHLKAVCLYGTPVSFVALRRLTCLPRLRTLHVPHTLLDEASAMELMTHFDDGVVSWNDDPLITTSSSFATAESDE